MAAKRIRRCTRVVVAAMVTTAPAATAGAAGAAFAATAPSGPAGALVAYPTKPIRFIIPFPPGGPRDVQARLVGRRLTDVWGQAVVIDNRAGASGMIGIELAAKAPADGHTLVMISASFASSPSLYAKLPYDTLRDFVPVAPLTSGPGILVVANGLPVKSVKELIAYARTRPGELHYGSAGNGVPSHLSMELFGTMTDTRYAHVPYKGMAPALNDVIGGQIQISLPTIPGGLPHAQAGRVRALGVSSVKRSTAAPEVPTIAEAGVPGFEASNWYGIAAPAGTPQAIVAKLNQEITRTVTLPDIRSKLVNMGMEPETGTPEAFADYLKQEVAKWARVVKASGLRLDL